MDVWLWLAATFVALPALVLVFTVRLRRDWGAVLKAMQQARPAGNADIDEGVADAQSSLYRDVLLAVLAVGALFYFVVTQSGSSLAAIGALGWFRDPEQVTSIADTIERVLVATSAFLVVFGVSAAFLPQLIPLPKHSRLSNVVSLGTAFCFGAAFALWLGTSSSPYDLIHRQLTQGFLQVFAALLSALFGLAGSYLAWKRIRAGP